MVNLQAQLAFLKDQAAQSFVNGSNPNQAAQSWNYENGIMNSNIPEENLVNIPEENVSYGSFEEGTSHSMSSFGMQTNYNRQWGFQDADELQSVVSSYIHHR